MRPETIALHAGYDSDPATNAVAVPIYQTVAYSFDSAAHGAALFDLEVEGFRYTRIGNPTCAVLEKRVAELEGGVDALVVSSGQSAMYYTVLNLIEPGRNLVSVPQLYGTTHTLFAHILPRSGIKVKFAAIAQRARIPLVVDNTVPTPILLRPIEYGADVVVHSLTKFLGGHGTTLGGAVVDSGRFRWEQMGTRFPMFTEPDPSYHGLVYTQHYGDKAFIGRMRSVFQRTMGAVLSPFNAFLLMQGIETVALRVERHVENARRVAEFLRADARVDSVSYVGFPDNPYYPLCQKYLGGRACSLLTFAIRGGYDAGTRFYDALQLFKRLVNLGDAKSLACHPASTTHRQMSVEEQRQAGIGPETIRLSVGIEHIDDIIADLDQALAAATRPKLRQTATT
jgi:O-acetylhomoserine (thiol)-lyase